MNKIFKVIFNRNKNRCEVASEFAKGHVKSSSAGQSLEQAGVLRYFPLSVLAVLVGLIGTPAWATIQIKDGKIISTSGTNVSNVTIADIYKGLQLGGGKSQVSYEGTDWVLPLGYNQAVHGGDLNTSNSTDSAANLANYTNNKAANANSVGTIAIGGGYTGATASGRGSVVVGDGASATGNVYSIGVTYYHDAYGNTLAYNPDNPLVAAVKSKSLGAYWSGAAAAFGNKAKADGGVALAVGTGSTAEGNLATALGGASKALRDNTVAVGYATATATNSIAQGASAFAGSKDGIAIGSKTRAGNSEEIAKLEKEYTDLQMYFNNGLQYNGKTVTQEQVGAAKKKLYEAYNESNVASAMAIGDGAQAWSYAGMALGRLADSRGSDAIAIGNSVKSYGERSIAIGAVAHAYNNSSVSLGDSARSVAEQAYAVGRNSKAGAKDVIVFGSGASAGWNDNLETLSQAVNTANDARNAAINEQNAANTALKQAYTDNNATAISAARDRVTKADADYETKNKARQDAITALKEAGKSNSAVDAIAIGNNANASGKSALALMRFATANATDAIVIGNSAEGSAERALALGYVAKASGKDAIAIGDNAKATNTNATAIGYLANASGVDSVAFGYSSNAIGESSLALGRVSIANATDAIAIGNTGYASGNNSIAIGRSAAVGYTSNTYNTKNGSNYTQDKVVNNSIALGYYARTEMDNSVALGTFSRVTEGEDTVTESQKSYLTNKDQSTKGIVSVGAGSSNYGSINDVSMTNALTRRITNVADGVLDDDAVTVAQLKKLQITGGGSETTVATTADITASDTSTDGVNHNYQLTLNKGKVAENETKVVSGGDVYSAINKAKPTVESKDNSVTVTKTAATATEGEKYDLSVKKDGQVVSGNTDVVTGGTVYSAIDTAKTELTDKGLKFQGDDGTAISKKLNETLTIKGGVTESSKLTDNNIGVESKDGALVVKLAKDVDLGSTGSLKAGNTKVSADGITFGDDGKASLNSNGLTITGGPSVTTSGIDAGGKKITKVANGTAGTDAVNYSQLSAVETKADNAQTTANAAKSAAETANKGWNLKVGSNTTTVKPEGTVTFADGDHTTVSLTDSTVKVNVKADGQVTSGNTGLVTGDAVNKAIEDAKKVSKTTVESKDNSVTVTKTAATATEGEKYDLSVKKDGQVVSGNTDVVTGGTVYSAIDTAKTELTDKGLKFQGDDSQAVAKKLGDTLTIKGGATGETADGNIKVVKDGDSLVVKLAKSLTGLQDINATGTITGGTLKAGDTSITTEGLTISGGPSVKKAGIDAGNKVISNVADGSGKNDAVNKGQLDQAIETVTGKITAAQGDQWNLAVQNGTSAAEDIMPDTTTKKVTLKAGDNVTLTKGTNGEVTIATSTEKLAADNIGTKTITIGGTSGTDGSSGTNGTTIAIAGKDGANGTNGQNGATGEAGEAGLDGKSITRIVYTDPDNKQHTVATLEDGLKFKGDSGDTIAKKLNEELTIKGGATGTLTDNNIGVESKDGALVVKLAKDVDLGANGSVKAGDTKVSADGITFGDDGKASLNSNGLTITGGPSVTTSGIDAGGKKITKVADGTANTDAVNKGQLSAVETKADNAQTTANAAKTAAETAKSAAETANKGWNLKVGSNTTTVKPEETVTFADGTNTTVELDSSNNTVKVNVVANGQVASGNNGLVTGDVVNTAIEDAKKVSKTTVESKDNSVTVTKTAATATEGEKYDLSVKKDGQVAKDNNDVVTGGTVYSAIDKAKSELTGKGLKFQGDDSQVVTKSLGDTLTIKGGKSSDLTDNNIGVVKGTDGSLVVKLAKSLTGLQDINATGTISGGTFKAGDNTLNSTGLTVGPVKVTSTGIDAGSQKITNVAAGSNANDAVNYSQLQAVETKADKANKGWNLKVGSTTKNIAPEGTVTFADGNHTTVSLTDGTVKVDVKADGKIETGNNGLVTGDAVNTAIEGAKTASKTTVKSDDASVTVTKTADETTGAETYDLAVKKGSVASGDTGLVTGDTVNTAIDKAKTELTGKGLKFQGDDSQVVTKSLGETLMIKGGATGDTADGNIKVVKEGDSLVVKLAKSLTGLQDITATGTISGGTFKAGDNTLDSTGLTIANGPSVTTSGINAGNKVISNVAEGTANGDAVNKGQLDKAVKDAKEAVQADQWTLATNDGTSSTDVTPDATSKKVTLKAGKNVSLENSDGTVTINASTEQLETQTVVLKGKDGTNGTTIAIAGKDGSNGTNGENGASGKALDDKSITRIVYTDPDNKQHTVATLEDGLKFKGDSGKAIAKKLNETLTIKGGATGMLTDNNIGVESKDGELLVKLAKDVDLGSTGSLKAGDTKVSADGITFGDAGKASLNSTGLTITGGASVTTSGIDAGSQKITKVADGTADSDAVNKGQLDKEIAKATTTVKAKDGSLITVTDKGTNGNHAYEVDITKGSVTSENGGVVTGGDVYSAINKAKPIVEAKDDSVTVDKTVGENGTGDTYKLSVKKDGQVVSGNNDVVTGGTVYSAIDTAKTELIDKGLKFQGDDNQEIAKKLSETLTIKGGKSSDLTDNNIGVVKGTDGSLVVKLAKLLTGLQDITATGTITGGTFKAGNNTLDSTGLTVGPVKVTSTGIDAGSQKITNVAAGSNANDAVNYSQLKSVETTANKGWNLKVGSTTKNIAPEGSVTFADGNHTTVSLTDGTVKVDVKADGKIETGNNGLVTGDAVNTAIEGAKTASKTTVKSDDASVTVTKTADETTGAETYDLAVKKGSVASGDTGLVTGDTVNTAIDKAKTELTGKGLKFQGDDSQVVTKSLGETLTIKGGATGDTADGNIKVVKEGDSLVVKLAKSLTGLQDITATGTISGGTFKAGDNTLDSTGLTIANGPSVTTSGINAGNKVISNVAEGTANGDAVNKGQLDKAVKDAKEAVQADQWTLATNDGTSSTDVTPDATSKKVTLKAGKNVSLENSDGTVTINASTEQLETQTVVLKGKDGTNGTTIAIAGKDGSNGTNGENGASGKALDDKSITRIVYTDPDNKQHTVATLEDGLKFKGDSGKAIAKKLNETLTIKGGATGMLTDNNIGVESKDGELLVKLAKDVDLGSTGSLKAGDTKVSADGITFGDAGKASLNSTGLTITGGASVTTSGIDAGSQKITKVADGTADSDAVNKGQLDKEIAKATTTVKAKDGSLITVTDKGTNGNHAYEVDITKGSVTSENGGVVTGGDVYSAINKAKPIVEAKDDSVTVDKTVGENGTGDTYKLSVKKDGQVVSGNNDVVTGGTVYSAIDTAKTELIDKGLKFQGDDNQEIAKKLSETLTIKGGKSSDLTDNNIGVVKGTDGSLVVKLAKSLTGLQDITATGTITGGTFKAGNNTLDSTGLTVGPVKVTSTGIDAGSQKITNVAAGSNANDAVNYSQLKSVETTANKGWNLKVGSTTKNIAPEGSVTFADGDHTTVTLTDSTVKVNVTANGKVAKDDTGLVKGGDVYSAIETAKTVAKTEVTSNDGSVTITKTEATDSTGEKYDLSVKKDGKVEDGNNDVVTGGTVYSAIEGAKTALTDKGLSFQGDDSQAVTKKLGDTLTIKGGKSSDLTDNNIGVVKGTDGSLVVKLAESLTGLKDITATGTIKGGTFKAGANTLNSTGLTIANGPSVTTSGIDAGSQKITKVASGLGNTNLADATGDTLTNAANIGDLKNAMNAITSSTTGGFGLKADDDKEVKANLGKTITVNGDNQNITTSVDNGAVKVALNDQVTLGKKDSTGKVTLNNKAGEANVTLDGDKGLTVGKVADKSNGTSVSDMGVISTDDQGNKALHMAAGSTYVGADGKTVSISADGLYNGDNKITGVAAGDISADSTDAVNGSQLFAIQNTVKGIQNSELSFQGDDGQKVSKKLGETLTIKGGATDAAQLTNGNIGVVNDGGNLVVKLAKDVDLGDTGSLKAGDTSVTKEGLTIKDGPSVKKTGIDAGSQKITNVKAGEQDTDAVNYGQLKAATQANKYFKAGSTGDNDDAVVEQDATSGSVAIGAGSKAKAAHKPTQDNNGYYAAFDGEVAGLTVNDQNPTGPAVVSFGTEGAERQLQHVAPGVISATSTDAINGSQLHATNMQVARNSQAIAKLAGEVNNVDRNLRGGVAGAMAIAGLYHSTEPGKSMISAGVGSYRGENAIALGYSKLSDNGKVGVKFSINTNSRGDQGVAASVGYQW